MKVDLCILSRSKPEAERVVKKAKSFFDDVLIWTESIDDFSKAKNTLQSKSGADYVLWWDTDEDFPLEFLKSLKWLLKNRPALCYRFPRKNLPDLSGYPDYQVRLFKRGDCRWIRPVHEVVMHTSGKLADQVECITLNEYPITHFPGTLYKRLYRFQRNMHTLVKAGFPARDLLKEVNDFVYEIKHRYDDQKC